MGKTLGHSRHTYDGLISLYLRLPLDPPIQDVSTGGGRGTVIVEVEMSPMMARASFRAW